jgi:predicted transcriptional regulator
MKKIILLSMLLFSTTVFTAENQNLAPEIGKVKTDLKQDFASAKELREKLNELQASEKNLKEIVKKQQELIETYEKIIEKLKEKAQENSKAKQE